MAHTKQTPRNPNLERPSAAMGSDVQPERRVPSKLTSKKVATKGGKQPHKHLLHKLIRQNKSTTGGIKKPHRYCLGLLALREICRFTKEKIIIYLIHISELRNVYLDDGRPLMHMCIVLAMCMCM